MAQPQNDQNRRPTRKPTSKERAATQSNRAKAQAPSRTPVPKNAKRNTRVAWYAVGGVLALVVIMVIVAVTTSSTPKNTSAGETAMAASVTKAATSIPTSVFDKVGTTSSVVTVNPPKVLPTSAQPIISDSKPVVLYVGGEYCPYCAAQRWALVASLSRFGTFSNLGATKSASTDSFPGTNTFDFYNSTYTSSYVVFAPKEIYSSTINAAGNGYTALQKLTPDQKKIVAKYSQNPQSPSIPLVVISNKLVFSGASYSPGALAGQTWNDIASGLSDPTNPVTQAIVATSNYMTAGICAATSGNPASVCKSPTIIAATKQLGL
jgi:hypothetical protein